MIQKLKATWKWALANFYKIFESVYGTGSDNWDDMKQGNRQRKCNDNGIVKT